MKHRLLALLLSSALAVPLVGCAGSPSDPDVYDRFRQRVELASFGLHDLAAALAPEDPELAADVHALAEAVGLVAEHLAGRMPPEDWLDALDLALEALEPWLDAEDAEIRAAVALARLALAQLRLEAEPPAEPAAEPPPSK